MGFSIQITSHPGNSWWPSSLHSLSLEARWHARNKELIAALLPSYLEGSKSLRACVMELTGPGDSTVTVREPAGRLDAVVKRQARKKHQAQTFVNRCIYTCAYANTQRERDGVQYMYAKWKCYSCGVTGTHIWNTLNPVSPSGDPDSSAPSFQSVSGSSKHPVQLLFLADCTCTT